MIDNIINLLNNLLWGNLLMFLLVAVGFFFTVRIGFAQFRYFRHGFKVLSLSRSSDEGLSSAEVFFTSMAARVGTGNMAGVAVAIVAGGPGAIFWMWIIALFGMATAMVESTLAQIYKIKDNKGDFRGGPAYYMERGLGQRWMGLLFSVFLIISFGWAFIALQANTITAALHAAFQWDVVLIGLALVVGTALVIMGGFRRVAKTATVVVPVMAGVYLLIAVIVIVTNFSQVPAAIMLIVESAFGLREAVAGGVAYTLAQAMQSGIARGLFSNEAGMGSAANIAASAAPTPNHPASQGFVQMIGVFFDTIIICTASAAIIILTDAHELAGSMNGVALLQHALQTEMGDWSAMFLTFAIFLFCFTTIVANYSYAETNVMFLTNQGLKFILPFKITVLAMVMFGSVAELKLVWNLADVSMGFMVLINIISLILLSGIAIKVIRDYLAQINEGKMPTFSPSKFPELKKVKGNVWKGRKL